MENDDGAGWVHVFRIIRFPIVLTTRHAQPLLICRCHFKQSDPIAAAFVTTHRANLICMMQANQRGNIKSLAHMYRRVQLVRKQQGNYHCTQQIESIVLSIRLYNILQWRLYIRPHVGCAINYVTIQLA